MRAIAVFVSFFLSLQNCPAQGILSADSIMADGKRKMNNKDYMGAIREFNRVIRTNPSNDEAFSTRAQVKYLVGDYESAYQDATKAIELKPTSEDGNFLLAEILLAQQKFADALPHYKKTLELNSNNLEAFRGKVFCTYYSGKEKEAFELVENAIAKDPGKGIYFYIKGILNNSKGKYSRALDDFNKALILNPGANEFNIYLNRGVSYLELEELGAAKEDLTQAIRLNPENASAYHSRGRLYYLMKQYTDAVKDFDRSLELNPNSDVTYYNLGMTYFRMENNKNACENFHKSCSMGNKNACRMIIMNCTGATPQVK